MVTDRTKAILLFTSYFAKNSDRNLKPLTTTEWNRFVRFLQTKGINPEDFLAQNSAELLDNLRDKTISSERINFLLDRKSSLAIALDKWSKAGIWIINRGDSEYPKRIKNKLKENAPPILFGIGRIELLNQSYIGVVGARKSSEQELNDTKRIGSKITRDKFGVVSGGAIGVDEAAMLGALEAGGFSLGFVADSLIKKSTSSIFRKFIIKKQLCLASPYNPEAGFNVGNAMARNKLIYTQSEATIVMKSDIKGGTWEGAKENIKKGWVPIWVINNDGKGNNEIVKMGAKKLSINDDWNISKLTEHHSKFNELELFSLSNSETPSEGEKNKTTLDLNRSEFQIKIKEASLFDLFLVKLIDHFKNKTVTKKEMKEELKLTNSQLDEWLKMGTERDFLIKTSKPLSFMINPKMNIRIVI
ncbi:DNA-protecting protein DprA [Fulvivirga sp. 29W222]|uniref:DNA-protecting protein DprA n=1 Tax=Fulvivirga marina TaxID=2494733 RepID=A0A937G2R2_9BACT|nr:DNA-processing protein DprA [Fulvivirga marina]MBL6447371.1 DNA-protecting protein DprA [Fulvivirga marina]